MSREEPPPLRDANEEVSVLIRALQETDQRLEELTSGEIDAVINRDGRSFLLRRAQDQLRYSEAAKQTAILNALPAHVAMLDSQGLVISVNRAWQRFGNDNAIRSPGNGIGLNYLEICDGARGDSSSDARRAAAGIRSVMNGAARAFSMEYPCHSPTQQRWFLMTVSPLADDHPNGAVIMHLNITERKYREEALRRFLGAMNAISDAVFLVDRSKMCYVHVNSAACRMQGQTRKALLAMNPWDVLSSSREDLEAAYDKIIASGEDAKPLEILRHDIDGSKHWVELRRHAQRLGVHWTIVTVIRDVTARKEAEGRIAYLNRVYAMLSGINTLIVRVRDRDRLFAEACRIAVEEGGFPLAWIGVVDPRARQLVPIASSGLDEEFLTALKDHFSSTAGAPLGSATTALAIREKKAVVSNDMQSDHKVLFGKKYAEAGIRTLAVLPLIVSDEAVGVLVLYATEIELFHDAELKLLTELAGNIAFAIDHIEKQERLNYLAYYDVLTGLANRTLFLERVAQYMRSAVSSGNKLALLLIDLERFKNINDSLGQPAGDALLKQVAEWLTRNVGDANLLTRVDADRFAVVLPQVRHEDEVARVLEKTIETFLDHSFRLNDAVFRISAKVGVALFPDDGTEADTLFKNAEAALKKAKITGDRYLFYTQKMTEAVAGRVTLENQLRQALDKGEFALHYQPKVDLARGELTGAEALIRWNDPRTGLVPPARFIPILEETGLIYEVGRWALRKAIEDYLRWRGAGLTAVRIAVNVSPLQLRNRRFISDIKEAVGIDLHAAAGLELEITESLIMADVKNSIASLKAIRALGVSIAIDDFGTGFSSLSYLSKLPVDTIKIDRSFVVDMTAGPEGLSLVSTIIRLAHSLKLKVVAEGVETEEQSRLLRLLDCDEFQGFLFSKPLPVEVFETRYLRLKIMQN